jgi:hypothetical protein
MLSKEGQRRTKKKNLQWGHSRKKKEGSWDPCSIPILVIKGLIVGLITIPLGLVVSLVYRFWGHISAYENNYFFK